MAEGVDSFYSEELDYTQLANFSPVITVRAKGYIKVIVGELFGAVRVRAGAAVEVVGFQYGFGGLGGGYDECGNLAEFEEEYGAVFLREFVQGLVWGFA